MTTQSLFSANLRSGKVPVIIVVIMLSLSSVLGQFGGAPTLTLGEERPTDSAQFGQRFAVGDFNNRGSLDLAVSSAGEKVTVFYGETAFDAKADLTLSSNSIDLIGFGTAIAAGDLNADGRTDLIVSAPYPPFDIDVQPSGKVMVYRGNSPLSTRPWVTIDGPTGEDSSLLFGDTLTVADLNGDKIDDLIIGDPWRDSVQIFFGAKTNFGRRTRGLYLELRPPGYSPENWVEFGAALAAGDVNGDGTADLVVGAASMPAGSGFGATLVYFGGQTIGQTPDATVANPFPGGEDDISFATVLAVGDVNGDEKADIIISHLGASAGGVPRTGRVYIYYGGSSLGSAPDVILDDPTPQSGVLFGYSIALGDLNQDKVLDVFIAAAGATVNNRNRAGRAYIFYGGQPFDTQVDITMVPNNPEQNGYFGTALVIADLNKDGKLDLVISSPGAPCCPPTNRRKEAGVAFYYRDP